MEERQNEVVLFGNEFSLFSERVELALKLKNIKYDYVEEDLTNKSDLLLQYNPVYKKVPVLVHKRYPISESLVILEYIDEYWSHTPKLLPDDPYQKVKLRFWANFFDQNILTCYLTIVRSKGKEQEEAIDKFRGILKVFEEGMKKDFPGKFPLLNDETLGLVDIVVGASACTYEAFNEAVAVVFSPESNPEFLSWVNTLKDHPLMKEVLPSHHQLVIKIRENVSSLLKVSPSKGY